MEHGSEGHQGLIEGNPWVLVAMSGIVIALLVLGSYFGMRRPGKVPGGLQNLLELIVSGLYGFVESIIGPDGRKFAPFIATIFLYILFMNLIGLVPFMRSPTSSLNTTIGLALTAFCYVQFQAMRAHGIVGYIKHFIGEPLWLAPLMFPIHMIGELAKPLSLSIRLFGNIFGEDKIIVILAGMSPFIIKPWLKFLPVQFPMMAFAAFTSFIQALIFTVLTAGYLTVLVGSHAEEAA